MSNNDLVIDKLILIDDDGMPKAPTIRQLIDKDVRALYARDKTKDKSKYIKECIVIYYMYDPKSPAQQNGLSDKEALRMAIEQAGLPDNYIPDKLVLTIGTKYYEQCITEAGKVVENIMKGIHNINTIISIANQLLNEKISNPATITMESLPDILKTIDSINDKAGEVTSMISNLRAAKEALMYEKQSETARGGGSVTSSMDASAY